MTRYLKKIDHLGHIIAVAVVGVLLLTAAIIFGEELFEKLHPLPKKISFGVTFSSEFAGYLKLDYQRVYLRVLDELGIKLLRLPTYWTRIETKRGQFDFSEVDFMVSGAQERGVKVILVVGARQPRWPECFQPDWVRELSLKQRQVETLKFIEKVVDRYQASEAIWAWQVENEPLFEFFGEGCEKPDRQFLKAEVELVRRLDSRPIIVTDSGELRPWRTPMRLSDIFGTTLYRTVYNNFFGYTTYPLLPYFYNLKSTLARTLFAPNNQQTIIVELQAEPWVIDNSLTTLSIDQQTTLFPLEKFADHVKFGRRTGFDEAYLWGVEWWYYMKNQGHPEYWQYAQTLFKN